LEIKQDYTTMHGQPIIKNYSKVDTPLTFALFSHIRRHFATKQNFIFTR